MRRGRIIDDAKKRKIGTKFIIHGRIPEGATISDIVAMVLENGREIAKGEELVVDDTVEPRVPRDKDDKPIDTGEPTGPQVKRDKPIDTGEPTGSQVKSIYTGEPIGTRGEVRETIDIVEPVGTWVSGTEHEPKKVSESEASKDGEEKVAPVWLGKAKKIGFSLLAAGLIISAIATTKITYNEQTVTPSDYKVTVEASDILLVTIDGLEIQVPSSVIPNPGTLIKHQRAEYIAENNGTYSGISEYFANTTNESRVAEEEKIEEITRSFDEQQQIINEASQVLQDENATDEQKREAIAKIQAAKDTQLGIYEANMNLFLMYNQASIDAFNRDGGDDRTAYEEAVAEVEVSEYGIAMQNLQRDVVSITQSIGTLDSPEILFEETSPEAGTTEKSYVIDTKIFGKSVKIWESSNKYYISVDYDTDIQLSEGHQVGEGVFSISADEIVNTETTKKNVFAIAEILQRLATHQELGEISVFGITIREGDNDNDLGDKAEKASEQSEINDEQEK